MIIKKNIKTSIYDYDYIVVGKSIRDGKKVNIGICKKCLEIFIKEAEQLLKEDENNDRQDL